jgi:aryl-alcohol dehydrogenase-like predicted oxidoreductase
MQSRLSVDRRAFLQGASAAAALAVLNSKADAAPADAKGEWRNRQPGMAYRRLGRTGYMISEVVMGGNTITPGNYEHILLSLDMGLNYLDTAPAYGRGLSEQGYSKVLKARPRDSFFLNSKVSGWDLDRNKLYENIYKSLPESERRKVETAVRDKLEQDRIFDPDYIGDYFPGQRGEVEQAVRANILAQQRGPEQDVRRTLKQAILNSVDASLRTLGTDYLDLLMAPHGTSTPYEIEAYPETFEAFEVLKKAGKVRHFGLSAHSDPANVLRAAIRSKMYSAAMVASSIVNHQFMRSALDEAGKANFGVIAMKVARPVYNGRNNGTADDPRRVKMIQDAIAGDLKVPQKAYVWMLRNPNISAVISEMGSAQLVRENVPLAAAKRSA